MPAPAFINGGAMRVRQVIAAGLRTPVGSLVLHSLLAFSLPSGQAAPAAAATFRVATFNVENYLEAPLGTRPAKTPAGRAAVRASLRALQADVVALQEIGGTRELLELRHALGEEGLLYPHWEMVAGSDTNIHVALLSRFPVTRRQPHTNEAFLLLGRKFHVSRAFLEVDLQVTDRYSLTLITAHLKSRRPIPEADEAEMREQEAVLLRQKIEARLSSRPNANLIVLGDFNDTKDSPSIRVLIGRGRAALTDTRPCERNGDPNSNSGRGTDLRNIAWTHYYAKEDSYSRIDYILISRGLAREWIPADSCVLTMPNWGLASDHRPIVATFFADDR